MPVNQLGSQWEKQVQLDGQPVQALLDSGLPITIVNLVCWLQIWKDNRSEHDPEWRDNAKKAVKRTCQVHHYSYEEVEILGSVEVTLKTAGSEMTLECRVHKYSNEEVEILGSVEVMLKIAGSEMTLEVLLQEEAPQDLLIGTDVFNQLTWTVNGRPLELNGERMAKTPVIRLIKAARIPPGMQQPYKHAE